MENLEIYQKSQSVPENATKNIVAGRLKGMTDINPMWRIKKLTELFGPVGFGWWYDITDKWIEEGANGVKIASIKINLYVKKDGEYSQPIQGIGGSLFIAKETNGLYTSDECYKMALTDAISVACKALGLGADIYWEKDKTKYDNNKDNPQKENKSKLILFKNSLLNDTLYKWMHDCEAQYKQKYPDKPFSLHGLLEKYYIITPEQAKEACAGLVEYEKQRNIMPMP